MSLVNGSTHGDSLFLTGRLEHPIGIWEVITSNWCWDWDSYVVSLSPCFENWHTFLYIYHLLCVTTPMSPITFGWLNWHMMDASDKKSFWFFSLEPGWKEREVQRSNIRFLTYIVFDIYSFYTLVVWEFKNTAFSFVTKCQQRNEAANVKRSTYPQDFDCDNLLAFSSLKYALVHVCKLSWDTKHEDKQSKQGRAKFNLVSLNNHDCYKAFKYNFS